MRCCPSLGGRQDLLPPAHLPGSSACHISKWQLLYQTEAQLSPRFDFCHHKVGSGIDGGAIRKGFSDLDFSSTLPEKVAGATWRVLEAQAVTLQADLTLNLSKRPISIELTTKAVWRIFFSGQPLGTWKREEQKRESNMGSRVIRGTKCSSEQLEMSIILENFCSGGLIHNWVC